jgi:hypothetical protein
MKLFVWLSGITLLLLLWAGCGDVFRPIIIPNPPTFPDPRAAHTVLSVNANPNDSFGTQINSGSVTVVDVSGDSVVSVANVGVVPVHAVQQTASQVLVVNQFTLIPCPPPPGKICVNGADSLSKIVFSGTTINVGPSNPTTISLPLSYDSLGNLASSKPNFVATTESSQAYVLMPQYQPNQSTPSPVTPSVAVINTLTNSLIATMPVGTNPYAMVETLDTKRLYVANNGTPGTISAFNTADRSTRGITGSLSSPPIWLSARSDSQRVFVLESSGTLAYLDTSTTAGPDVLTECNGSTVCNVSVPNATQMTYDGHLNRLYIAGGTTAAVVDVSGSFPQVLATINNLAAVQPSSRGSEDPCAATAATSLSAFGVTALPDGSRAYVGAYYRDASGNICPQVTVLNATSNTVKTAIAVPGFANFDAMCAAPTTRFRFAMAAAGDSSRAYLSACDGGNINIIDTLSDTYALSQQAPVSTRPPVPPNTQQPPQNPVFLIAGP